jgi:choline-sulfatase
MKIPAVRALSGAILLLSGLAILGWTVRAYRMAARAPRTAAVRSLPRGRRPVLLVTLDTTRADHLEPYGATDVKTPTLARLAADGILFEHATSVAPITLVAHTSIHTGLDPPRHGVRNNGLHYVPPEVTTLAEILKAEGFRTAAFVSAAVLEKHYGLDQGFETYDDDLSAGRERHPRMVADRPAGATVAAAKKWLDALPAGEPFFLWVHFYDPHAAYSPPPPFRDQYKDRLYDGEIAYMDSQLGELLAHPRLTGDRAPIVIALGDHGESLGEHGEQTHAILPYEATLHVPWIMKVPGGPAGLRVDTVVSQVDLMPSVLDLLKLPVPDGLSGHSLLPLLEGHDSAPDRYLYSETYLPFYTYGWAKLRAFRHGHWKFVSAPSPELYDIERDPRELSNVIAQEPGRAHDLHAALDDYLRSVKDSEKEAHIDLDSERIEALRSLGYLAVGSEPPRAASQRPDPKDMVAVHVGLETSRQLLDRHLYDEAIARLKLVLDRDPANLAALLDLATAYQRKNRIEDAARTAEQALKLDPKYVRIYALLAELEVRRGKSENALKLLDEGLRLDPRYDDAVIQKAMLLAQLRRGGEAKELLVRALAREPDQTRLNAAYADVVEVPAGDLAAGERRLRAVVARDPYLLLAWRSLGEVCERAQRPEDAITAYQEGLKRQPDDADLHGRLGLLLARKGSDPRAYSHLTEAIRLSEVFRSELHVALGAWLASNGKLSQAEEEYAKVLAVEPRSLGARNNRAVAHYRSGRLDQAVAEWEALLKEYPRHADVLSNLSAAALDRRQWSRAEDYARRAIAFEPKTVETWNNLGIAQDEQGRYAEAEKTFRQAEGLDPAYWQTRNNLATTLKKEKRWKESAALFEKVLDEVPLEPEVHFELGELYAGPLRDPDRARKHLNTFLAGAPRDPRVPQVRKSLARLTAVANDD